MTNPDNRDPILVLGGTGKTGRRVVERLERLGVPFRIGSRAGRPPFDWARPETWPAALDGADAIYLTYQPDIAVPGALDAIRAFVELALEGGTRRIVLLSGRGEEEAERAERMLQASAADWTIIRASWFAQNFSEDFLLDAVLSGEVALPAGAVAEPFVDVDDIADIAAAALTDARHVGRLYEVTGPQLLTFAEAVAAIAEASGRPVRYREISLDAFAAGLEREGLPGDLQAFLLYLFGTVLDGRNAHVTTGVHEALEREPGDFADFARRAAKAGAWSAVR